jgi:hypothetical protein
MKLFAHIKLNDNLWMNLSTEITTFKKFQCVTMCFYSDSTKVRSSRVQCLVWLLQWFSNFKRNPMFLTDFWPIVTENKHRLSILTKLILIDKWIYVFYAYNGRNKSILKINKESLVKNSYFCPIVCRTQSGQNYLCLIFNHYKGQNFV